MAIGTKGGLLQEERQAQSVYKHAILRQYLPRFIAKTGAVNPRVVLVDGYAGTGSVGTGPGSARLMLEAAQDTRSKAHVDIFLVESDAKNYAQLSAVADLFRQNGIQVQDRKGAIETELPPIITAATGASLFLFLDPCGALLPFDCMSGILTGPRKFASPPTEAFLNFSSEFVRRAAGQFVKRSSDQGGALLLDKVCGGTWWQQMATDLRPQAEGDNYESIVLAVAEQYAKELGAATRMHATAIPVRKKLENQPIYHLIFLTRHSEGLWSFADSLGAARPNWLEAMPPEPDLSEPDLFAGTDVVLDGVTLAAQMRRDALRDQAGTVTQLVSNIGDVARAGRPFRVIDHLGEVLAGVLGVAREKQIREALNELVEMGQIKLIEKGKRLQRNWYEPRISGSL